MKKKSETRDLHRYANISLHLRIYCTYLRTYEGRYITEFKFTRLIL